MATTAPRPTLFGERPGLGSKSLSAGLFGQAPDGGLPSSSSPRTPLLGRSISSQFGSPSAYRSEQEEYVVYELGARHLSAGFAGESRPRCVYAFGPDRARRLGDYRTCDPNHRQKRRKLRDEHAWGEEYELYRADLRSLDLGLVEDRLERAVRTIHIDHLQLDQKSRKAVLVMPSLLPTPLVEIALKILFDYSSQLPSVLLLTTPFLACVSAGLRSALVVDIGWEETVVTAVGEYKDILQRRSVRAGKALTREMARLLEEEMAIQIERSEGEEVQEVAFQYSEEVTKRMAWCRPRLPSEDARTQSSMVKLPIDDANPNTQRHIHLPFQRLSKPAETTFFANSDSMCDDHDLSLLHVVHSVLLALPLDLRAICVSRLVMTGGVSEMPGLKQRLLQELAQLIETRHWDPVHNYGSAAPYHERILQKRSANIIRHKQQKEAEPPLSPAKKPIQENVPHMERIHDDKYDEFTQKAEREANRGKTDVFKGVVRGVETLGPWAGASLVASLRVKGVHDVEREDFLKHGLRDDETLI